MKAATIKQNKKSPKLREEFERLAHETGEKLLRLKFEDPKVYVRWMHQHHYLVRRTMRYISLAAGLCPVEDQESFAYWMKALKEETNHHKMLENDARHLGVGVDTFVAKEVTKNLAARLHDDMLISQGRALFGYALLLEGMSCTAGKKFMDRVVAAHGKKAASFLALHTVVDDGDDGHFAHGLDFIEEHYDQGTQAMILDVLYYSAEAYSKILSEVAG